MPTLKRPSRLPLCVALTCVLLAGCDTVVDALTVPIYPPPPQQTVQRAPAARARPARAPLPVASLDFRVLAASARIAGRDYVMIENKRPLIHATGEHHYRLDIPLRRTAKSSWRGDVSLSTHFYYDGVELIFFGDQNGNQRLDRHEPSVRHIIDHRTEIVSHGKRHYLRARQMELALRGKHTSLSGTLRSLTLQLIFPAGHR